MSDGEDDASASPELVAGTNRGYEIGYRKPPKATQFRKGRSGNPRGRPKRSKSP
jgi:hypothetical protein